MGAAYSVDAVRMRRVQYGCGVQCGCSMDAAHAVGVQRRATIHDKHQGTGGVTTSSCFYHCMPNPPDNFPFCRYFCRPRAERECVVRDWMKYGNL